MKCTGSGDLTKTDVQSAGSYGFVTKVTIGEGIKVIKSKSFYGCNSLVSIQLPSTITTFEGSAFETTALPNFTIPASVTSIDSMAFNSCRQLAHFYVESGNKYYTAKDGFLFNSDGNLFCVGAGRAKNDVLKLPLCEIILKDSLRWNACTSLVIADSTVSVKGEAIYKLNNLKTITIGKNLMNWTANSISACAALESFTIHSSNAHFYYSGGVFGKHYVKGNPVSVIWVKPSVTSVKIGRYVTVVGQSCLQNCPLLEKVTVDSANTRFVAMCTNQLLVDKNDRSTDPFNRVRNCVGAATSITLPSDITHIYSGAFRACIHLTSVKLHSGNIKIFASAFRECPALTTFNFANCKVMDGNGNARISSHCFASNKKLATVSNWPEKSYVIASNAFYDTGFTTLTLTRATILEDLCFAQCTKLEELTIPKSVTALDGKAFYSCTLLSKVIFETGSTMSKLDSMVFSRCTSLVSIQLPSSLTNIISSCFAESSSLVSITFDGTSSSYISDGVAIYKKDGTNPYHTFAVCPPGLANITLNDDTYAIGTQAFYSCNKLVDVIMNDKITEIAASAFFECTSIRMIRLTASIKTIGERAFQSCVNLEEILCCTANNNVAHGTDPFPANPKIYLFYDYPIEQGECRFCGLLCEAKLDHECNIPTEHFSWFPRAPRETSIQSIFRIAGRMICVMSEVLGV